MLSSWKRPTQPKKIGIFFRHSFVLLRQACVGRKKTALVELSFGAARAYRAGEPDGDELVWEAGSAWR